MKYCRNCGKEIDDNAVICTNCGATVQENLKQVNTTEKDVGGFGWGILGFFFPIVGLILFLVWKDQKPITAKSAGIGALVGFISSFVISTITSIFYASYFMYI